MTRGDGHLGRDRGDHRLPDGAARPRRRIVLIEPLYDTYLPVVEAARRRAALVRLSPPDWTLPRDELAAAFGPGTKALLFNSPMNPTGKVFSAEELGFIADLLQRHDAYAICDEVYEHLVFDGERHVPLMTLPGMRDRSLRIGSAGKTFSLTGWKVGYITARGAPDAGGAEGASEPDLHHRRPICNARSRSASPRTMPISPRCRPNLQARRDQLAAGPRRGRVRRAADRRIVFHHHRFRRRCVSTATTWHSAATSPRTPA